MLIVISVLHFTFIDYARAVLKNRNEKKMVRGGTSNGVGGNPLS
jgi:hypothetical protein